MPFKRSVSQLGFVDVSHRAAPEAFAKRPTSLREIAAAGNELGIDVFFTPQYMWLAEEYLCAKLPAEWSQVLDPQHQAYYYYNSHTGESVWENPQAEYYKSQYQKQRKHDEEQGIKVLGMASRQEAHSKLVKGGAPPQGVGEGTIVRPQADAGALEIAEGGRRDEDINGNGRVDAAAKAKISDIRNKLKKVSKTAVKMRVKKGNTALRGGSTGEIYTPKMFEELCQYLGIHIIDRDPNKVECHLIHLALEYLDRVHSGELPEGWTAYMDTESDIPYYYNSRTGENTYDHPLASEMKSQVVAARELAKSGDEVWSRGSVADYWLIFGGETISYYNLRHRKTFRSPPHVARQAAETIVRVVRLGSNNHSSSSARVKRSDIVDAFHALDADQSGSVSAEELRPVLVELGGLNEAEVNTLIAAADIDGDGEMDYNEFVDTLWKKAELHATSVNAKSSKVGSKHANKGHILDASGNKISSESTGAYEVHGHVHDAIGEAMTQMAEEEAWKIEREQSEVKSELDVLARKIDQTEGAVKDAWTIIDYNRALDLLSRGRACDIFNEDDKYHTGAAPVARRITRAVTEYEEAEAERRAAAILDGHHAEAEKLGTQRDACKRDLRSASASLDKVKISEYKDAIVEKSLNGFLYPEVRELEECVRRAGDLLVMVEDRAARIPERELDLKPNMVKRFRKEVNDLQRVVNEANKAAEEEIKRRVDLEKRAVQARDMEIVRKRQAAEAKAKAIADEERARKEAIDKLDAEFIAAEERAEKEAADRQAAMDAERARMITEVGKLEEEQNSEHSKVEEWAASWDPMKYASQEEREEAEIQHEIKLEEMKIREAEERKKREEKRKRLEAELALKEEKLRKQLEAEAAARKKEEQRKRELAEAKARWEVDQKKEEARTQSRERRLRKREERLRKARAALDEIDVKEEERLKSEAKAKVEASGGDVWDACRNGDLELLRCFFILQGTAALLEGKESRCHHKEEWGRTLVHQAAWWGHTPVLRFLLTLGADVNVHDTSVTRTTPLIEAARTGRRRVCEFLIRYGAKLKIADSFGDTPIHWASRRAHGSLIAQMLEKSEEYQGGGSTRGLLTMTNNKLHIPLDVATNETVRELIRREMKRLGEKKKSHKKTVNKIRGGLLRAKMVGKLDDPFEASQMKKKRYGKKGKSKKGENPFQKHETMSKHQKKKKKKKKKNPFGLDSVSADSSGSSILPEVKTTRKPRRTASEIAAAVEANKHHADLGDGGIPDELVGFMALDDFHYGVREY